MGNAKICESCKKPFFGAECFFCNKNKRIEGEQENNFRNGLCHYNHKGEYCPLPGSLTRDAGPHPVKMWYCSYHLECLDPKEGFKILNWAKKYRKDIITCLRFPLYNERPRVFSEVLAHAPSINHTTMYEDFYKFKQQLN